MAIDVYLQIDGISGESLDDNHRNWIECIEVHWGLAQPKSSTASTGGGHTAERCQHSEINFLKLADRSSPILMQSCSTGKTIAKARLEFMRADGLGERIKYFEINLENVLVCHVTADISEGEILTEHVGLKFSKVSWQYIQQRVSGGIAGNTAGSWNLANNRIA
ncbi:type VI secretion system secreted protein Hcp [Duganella sp. CF517]|uniref:Hcp family type VI secretion system effector n=1 Tax=Duganella sp. CF517 TaxID=1881038 RepID=UPI0008C2BF10|nr:type VI secretion system tube protein Hcp [Duganella sp. CF517]SEO57716.1 type VI secretion system secreted protein Hcp [Duganella sp. CF517]